MEHIQDEILSVTKELLSFLEYDCSVDIITEGDGYLVQVNTEDTGVLIGYHGQTLSALQTILGHALYKRTGQWLKITLNVSDYWQKRQEQLENMAKRAVEEVLHTHTSYTLPYLNAKERRHIHMILSDEPGIKTESVGEGRERRLVVFPQ